MLWQIVAGLSLAWKYRDYVDDHGFVEVRSRLPEAQLMSSLLGSMLYRRCSALTFPGAWLVVTW